MKTLDRALHKQMKTFYRTNKVIARRSMVRLTAREIMDGCPPDVF